MFRTPLHMNVIFSWTNERARYMDADLAWAIEKYSSHEVLKETDAVT
jgi:hypothetical protein